MKSGSIIRILLSIALFQISLQLLGQEIEEEVGYGNFLPPSPTASELGKYGLVPVGLSTGTPNIDIPLYTFSTQNLSVPISLSYNSNGIKVDQIASWVGLGWSLNAGGVITRIVRDEADDMGYMIDYPSDITEMNPETIEYIEGAKTQGVDTEPDLFTFNFMGNTGKFVMSRQGKIIVMPHQNLWIERFFEPDNPGAGYFIITTPDGIKYTFGQGNATETSRTFSAGTGCGKTYDYPKETAWYITAIKHPSGDIIHFEYESSAYTYSISVSQTITKRISPDADSACEEGCPITNLETTCENLLHVNVARLTKIWAENRGEMNFKASLDRLDLADYKLDTIEIVAPDSDKVKYALSYEFSNSGSNYNNSLTTEELKHRMFLKSVREQNENNTTTINQYAFAYNDINGMPPRLSFAQDHWGYFNGEDNQYFVPENLGIEDFKERTVFSDFRGDREPKPEFAKKGLLTQITYPTGGATSLYYEGNSYSGVLNASSPDYFTNEKTIDVYALVPEGDVLGREQEYIEFYSPYDQKVEYEFNTSISASQVLDPTHDKVSVTVFDITDGSLLFDQVLTPNNYISNFFHLRGDHFYRVNILVEGEEVDGHFWFNYYTSNVNEVSESSEQNILTGGVRVNKTEVFDPVSNRTSVANYKYGWLNSDKSSGEVGIAYPNYYQTSTSRRACNVPCTYYDCQYGSLYSNSLYSLYPGSGNNVYYSHVIVSKGDGFLNGVEEHDFIVNFDVAGANIHGEPILGTPYTNSGWNNGLERETKTYKTDEFGNLILTKYLENEFVTDSRVFDEVPALIVKKKYEEVCPGTAVYYCTEADTSYERKLWGCTADHKHFYAVRFLGREVYCMRDPSRLHWSVLNVWTHPCYGLDSGDTVVVPQALDYLDVLEYKNIGYWYYLNSKTLTEYDQNGENPIVTVEEYEYDNEVHGLMTAKRLLDDEGNLIKEQRFRYPDDFDEEVENYDTLKSRHIVSTPIKIEESFGGVQSKGQVFSYTDFGKPAAIYAFKIDENHLIPTHDPTSLDLTNYELKTELFYSDDTRNIKNVKSNNDVVKTYLWGYNNTQLIAYVVGANESNIYVNSFEEDGLSSTSKTGERSFLGSSFTIPLDDRPTGSNLKMTFWYWDSDHWEFSGVLDYDYNVSTTGTRIDELRVFPEGAQITSYTYDLGKGVSSVTDPNNISTYYIYDDFGRLVETKDDKGNITSQYKYHYANNN